MCKDKVALIALCGREISDKQSQVIQNEVSLDGAGCHTLEEMKWYQGVIL
jgi:hypothetical protein